MAAALVEIATAVATAFAGGYAASPRTVSLNIDVERGYVPGEDWQLDRFMDFSHISPGSKAVKVYVAADNEQDIADKSTRQYRWIEYEVQVAIAAKPKTTDPADVDPLLLLVQDLRNYFFHADQTTYALAGRGDEHERERATKIETLAHPDLEKLRLDRLFHAGFVLTFEGYRLR